MKTALIISTLIFLFALTPAIFEAEKYDFVVAQDGSGDFTSIQKHIYTKEHIFAPPAMEVPGKNNLV